ncbi:MAG: UDP-3-O-(3-hydroxymyristoyl)glucosamine N-acyltransferase [Sphingobacteriia bacterium]|nr:UDP-3-O-(3-hydroxymyristoyl)glucosamine N-acyltransferase [Sphingobacteriia bacterium]
MEFSAQQIAALLSGTVEGDPEIKVSQLSKIEEGKPGTLSFLANPLYTQYIYTTAASIVIVSDKFIAEKEIASTLIRVADPYASFATLLDLYNKLRNDKKGVSKLAHISDTAVVGEDIYVGEFSVIGDYVKLGNNVKIYPQAYIGDNTIIGDNTTIYAGVKIYSDTVIGNNCTVHSGTVIGADGFGFAPQQGDTFKKVAQIGNVVIEDWVEIGANTCIDRATLGSTVIKRGVKLDNLIQVAHNVEIGNNTVIAAQTGISGSTHIGANCMFGGQVGIAGHLKIADEVKMAAQSGVASSVKTKGAVIMGAPAIDAHAYQRAYVVFKQLPELEKRLRELERATFTK